MRRKPEFWIDGIAPAIVSEAADEVTVQDTSLDVLYMLRIINALNRRWATLYFSVPQSHIIPQTEFIHSKIAAGHAGDHDQQPAPVPAVERRHLSVSVSVQDTPPAILRGVVRPELGLQRRDLADTSERVTPRLDQPKRVISREDILNQVEAIIQDIGHSKALLEIQYEDEVGTGLRPTQEFSALVRLITIRPRPTRTVRARPCPQQPPRCASSNRTAITTSVMAAS